MFIVDLVQARRWKVLVGRERKIMKVSTFVKFMAKFPKKKKKKNFGQENEVNYYHYVMTPSQRCHTVFSNCLIQFISVPSPSNLRGPRRIEVLGVNNWSQANKKYPQNSTQVS